MDLSTAVFLGLVAILAINQAAARLEFILRARLAFLCVQALNVGLGCGILVYGLPGWHHAPIVRWVVGLLFLVHTATNGRRFGMFNRARARELASRERDVRREAIERSLES